MLQRGKRGGEGEGGGGYGYEEYTWYSGGGSDLRLSGHPYGCSYLFSYMDQQ